MASDHTVGVRVPPRRFWEYRGVVSIGKTGVSKTSVLSSNLSTPVFCVKTHRMLVRMRINNMLMYKLLIIGCILLVVGVIFLMVQRTIYTGNNQKICKILGVVLFSLGLVCLVEVFVLL